MALDVQISGRNFEVTDRIHDYVEKKVSKLGRYLAGVDEARVDLVYEKAARSAADRYVAQITVRGKGLLLRAEESADDLYAAFDTAVDKMQRQMERFKGKRNRGRGDGRTAAEVIAAENEEGVEIEMPLIVRRKKFEVTPVDEAEALEQMALLGHENFFIFFNVATNSLNVLYRRRDGTYGLIEPVIR